MTALTWRVLKNSWVLKSSPFPAVLTRVYMWPSTIVRVGRRLNCEQERWVQRSLTQQLSVSLNVWFNFLFLLLTDHQSFVPYPHLFFPSLLCIGNRGKFCLNYIFCLSSSSPNFFFFLSCLVPPQGMWCCKGTIIDKDSWPNKGLLHWNFHPEDFKSLEEGKRGHEDLSPKKRNDYLLPASTFSPHSLCPSAHLHVSSHLKQVP